MTTKTVQLSKSWSDFCIRAPESGMGYLIATIELKNGTKIPQAVIMDGCISQIRGMKEIPFTNDDIQVIIPTHERWAFNRE